MKCSDPRIEFLSHRERDALAPFTIEPANDLVSSLRRVNVQIAKLRLDTHIDVTTIVVPLLDAPQRP